MPQMPVFFNVDGVVGAFPAQNKIEDVLLVQFAFSRLANDPGSPSDLNELLAYQAVSVTGVMDDATIEAITVYQWGQQEVSPGQVVDSRVSPARGYSYGPAFWTIVGLNFEIQTRHMDVWPRIDKIPACPELLRQMVIRSLVGTP
jgi:hypothetical protein